MAVFFMTAASFQGLPSRYLQPASNLTDLHDYHKKSRPVEPKNKFAPFTSISIFYFRGHRIYFSWAALRC
jgi:hypothetical protein